MSNRERLKQFLITLATVALSILAARYGIPIPPPVVPEGAIPPPVVVLPPERSRPAPLDPEPSRPDTMNAICRIAFGNAGCTATVIGPRRADGRWNLLTAAHCVRGVGQLGEAKLKDGRKLVVEVTATDPRSDCAWLVTREAHTGLPFALLAERSPTPGTPVFHAGYGVDKPGNREEGSVIDGPDQSGQLRFRLSVSSGDSGGGICTTADGVVVSAVCCTTARGRVADVWGCSPESARKLAGTAVNGEHWEPLEIPLRKGE